MKKPLGAPPNGPVQQKSLDPKEAVADVRKDNNSFPRISPLNIFK
jgi:hypothetical protein